MKNKIKKFLIKLAYKFKCHPECDLEVPCHCNKCDEPNTKDHYKVHEKIVIVPSGRIDYCCMCKKEHGYDCPLDVE